MMFVWYELYDSNIYITLLLSLRETTQAVLYEIVSNLQTIAQIIYIVYQISEL